MPDLPLIDTDFAGYRLRAVIGRGGMSIVYRAENPRLRNVIALKVLAPELADDQIFRIRFREESQIAASLNHPNIIPIHDFGSCDGLLYIAMHYVSGTDLRRLIAERGLLAPDTAIYLLEQAARALDTAHRQGLVHRDVKPGNLLVAQSNDNVDPEHVYLADFGITKYAGRRTGLTSAGMLIGTVHYTSPEQIQELTVLGAADQYSLGCVLYECLTGRAPFEKSSSKEIMWAHVNDRPAPPTLLRPDLPPAVDEVIARVLAKDPGDRYANCREFIASARGALATADGWTSGSGSGSVRAAGSVRTAGSGSGWTAGSVGTAGSGSGWTAGEFQSAPVPSGKFPGPVRPTVKEPLDPTASLAAPRAASGPAAARPGFSFDDGHLARPHRVRTRRRRRRPELEGARSALSLAAIGVCVAAIAGGGTAAGMLLIKTSDVTTGSVAAGSLSVSGQHAASPTSQPASSPPASTLTTVLDDTERFTGMLRMSDCVQQIPARVQCTNPDPAIASVTFATYPTLGALYAKYQEIVGNLTGGHFAGVANMRVCGPLAPEPTAESTWNHSDQYYTKYSVAQLASGDVPSDVAMGRLFCEQTQNGSEYIVWTQDSGHLLGYATGAASHEQVWNWFYTVHRNITFPGQPGMTEMPTSPPAASGSSKQTLSTERPAS